MMNARSNLPASVRALCFGFALVFLRATAVPAQAPKENPYFARLNTFSIFTAYSPDSSPILMGTAQNRILLNFGLSYSRRLLLNRKLNWQFNAEFAPIAFESDPVWHIVTHQTSPTIATYTDNIRQATACVPESGSYSYSFPPVTYAGTFVRTCSRIWTMGEAFSPAGLQWNFRPRHRLQPLVDAHGGFIYSTIPIPIDGAGSFNFTFDFGAGIEFFRSRTRSLRLEYRYHHISNKDTADLNPGIDNGLFQLTWSFGH
ncbi:MAG TPA: acyloxyacyl hydrolase [Terracidiphilus sp.]|nr:acyloxyacyl hydrolase [Terracidiphilus sp.]